ncbi:hypothetical protein RJ55_05383 [Drechmeria coniospora]|nr:hypothetical protein RJ55_05383 [Drechmeria coniospora]
MATPRPHAASPGGAWSGALTAAPTPTQPPPDETGLQSKPMGLKVHYTFDKEAKVNCLARHPQTLVVQTVPVDDRNTIGIVDLRSCVHAIVQCSPELAGHDSDYAVYAVDYSESDLPLVGQGMLSWILDSMRPAAADPIAHQPQMVTGRVTKNLLAVFGGGNKDTLEVRLRLSSSAKALRPLHHDAADLDLQQQGQQHGVDRLIDCAIEAATMTSPGGLEWNAFVQSNPQLGHAAHVSRVASPALSQSRIPAPNVQESTLQQQPPAVAPREQTASALPPAGRQNPPPEPHEVQRVAPTPVDLNELPTAPSSRPSSRASNRAPRKRQPTGRPRGRPRKRPAEAATSGAEDAATETDDASSRKRAKTTKANAAESKAAMNPFAAANESLRVAASISGSLRNFRPVAAGGESAPGGQFQETPRAPTPVPEGSPYGGPLRTQNPSKLRRESTLGQQHDAARLSESRLQPLSPSQEDGRSPESLAATPAAFSDGSMLDICSSPPMQRPTPFMRSSPPPSSPVLPPMPASDFPHPSTFAHGELEALFGEEPLHRTLQPTQPRSAKPMPKRASGVPIQVFQMQDGPMGQDMVFLHSLNGAPHPSPDAESQAPNYPPAHLVHPHPMSAPPAPYHHPPPPSSDAPTLPPLKNEAPGYPNAARVATRRKPKPVNASSVHRPSMVPTPPPTTDAAERPTSPLPAARPSTYAAQENSAPVAEPIRGLAQEGADPSRRDVRIKPASPEPASTTATPVEQQQQQQQQTEEHAPKERSRKPPTEPSKVGSRSFGRSQSAGALILPQVAASEPAGPSSLSHSVTPELDRPPPAAPSALKRAASSGPLALPVPASDPVGPASSRSHVVGHEQAKASVQADDAAPPPSSPPVHRSNKNFVKKNAIKQRLEQAIINGEMPPFCSNCGNIETPTWRKIWVQEKDGELPKNIDLSEKPGMITALEVLTRDADEKVTRHRITKKGLAPKEDKSEWEELLLCNPCGIWLCKCKVHRPADRWNKDQERLGQERRRKGTGRNTSRPKKSRPKSEAPSGLTSEAYLPTDPCGPPPHKTTEPAPPQANVSSRPGSQQDSHARAPMTVGGDAESLPGSTHSRGSGTAQSPVDLSFDEAVGSTKRLLFPSPKKDGQMKSLGGIDANVVQVPDEFQPLKGSLAAAGEKENALAPLRKNDEDDFEALFRSPALARPSTPPPNAEPEANAENVERFKTPTRRTPSHRPITRSVTRSVSRSLRMAAVVASPSQLLAQQTPTKTPRFGLGALGSVGPRRSPRNLGNELSPTSRNIHEAFGGFSDDISFDIPDNMDLNLLPMLDQMDSGLNSDMLMCLDQFFSTDALMTSSPPQSRTHAGLDGNGSPRNWAQ